MVARVAAHYDDDDDNDGVNNDDDNDDADDNDVYDTTADSPREKKRTKKVLKCPNADRSRFRNKTKNAPKKEKKPECNYCRDQFFRNGFKATK